MFDQQSILDKPVPKILSQVLPNVFMGQADKFIGWGRGNSPWYLLFGLACCGIELMQTGGPRADLDRFGSVFRPTPRQSDFIIVAGTLTLKMASRLKLLYDQMAEPKYVISMGSCSNCGGLFDPGYSVMRGVDKILPIDIYVPGCPPRPEALTAAVIALQEKIKAEKYLQPGERQKHEPIVIEG